MLGFQARRLHEDDPLQAKYVNTPESELFTKGAVVYGLDKARAAIAREDRACVVEGNTDVIALRQAGFEPVVACMGTALTEQQLRELNRLTQRLWLAFDGDAAGESAALRGMELAVKQGFDVKVVALPPGRGPGRRAGRLRGEAPGGEAVRPLPHAGRGPAGRRPRGGPAGREGVPRRRARHRSTGGPPGAGRTTTSGCRSRSAAAAPRAPRRRLRPRVAGAVDRLERGALAGVIALPEPRAGAGRDHRRSTSATRRTARCAGISSTARRPPARRSSCCAELDAWAPQEGIDLPTAKELLLRLGEREVRAELQHADLGRTKELHETLARIQEAIASIAENGTAPD